MQMRRWKLALVLLGIVTCLFGCEVKSDLPVYQQKNAQPQPTSANAAQEASTLKSTPISPEEVPFTRQAYLEDEAIIAEIDEARYHALSIHGQNMGTFLGIREMLPEELERKRGAVDKLVAGFYNWNHTSDNEALLQTGYGVLSDQLRVVVAESGHFESFIKDVKKYTLDTKIRYADIIDDGIACDYLSEELGLITCVRVELVPHTVADDGGQFYSLYDYYVRGDTMLELLVVLRDDGEHVEVLGWDEFFPNPKHFMVYYPDYVGELEIAPEQINAVGWPALYDMTGKKHSFQEAEQEKIEAMIDRFLDNYVTVRHNWQFDQSYLTRQQIEYLDPLVETLSATVEAQAPDVEMRDLACRELKDNAFDILTDHDGVTVYKLTLTYMLNNKGGVVHELMLLQGIRDYETTVVFAVEGDTFKIDYWRTKEKSLGELDIDFYAESIDQG